MATVSLYLEYFLSELKCIFGNQLFDFQCRDFSFGVGHSQILANQTTAFAKSCLYKDIQHPAKLVYFLINVSFYHLFKGDEPFVLCIVSDLRTSS